MLQSIICCYTSLRSQQVLITNGNLDIVDDGIKYVIRTDESILDKLVTRFPLIITLPDIANTGWINGAPSNMLRFACGYISEG